MRFSIKWGGAQFIPTASTLSLLFITSRQSLKLSPEGVFSPSTVVKQIQDGIWTFSSSSNSTQACNKYMLKMNTRKNFLHFRSNKDKQKVHLDSERIRNRLLAILETINY